MAKFKKGDSVIVRCPLLKIRYHDCEIISSKNINNENIYDIKAKARISSGQAKTKILTGIEEHNIEATGEWVDL